MDLKEAKQLIENGLQDVHDKLKEKASAESVTELSDKFSEIKDTLASIELSIDDVKVTDYVKTMQSQVDEQEKKIKELEIEKLAKTNTFEKDAKALFDNEDFKKSAKSRTHNEFMLKADVTTGSFTADSGAVAMDQLNLPGVQKHPWQLRPLYAGLDKQFVGEKVNTITYYDENTSTNSAAAVAEGAAYAQSDVTLVRRVLSFYKAGHYVAVTEETLEDSDLMLGELDSLLRNGVAYEQERQLALGAGDGSEEVLGIINQTSQVAKDFAKPTGLAAITNPNIYDVLRVSKLQVRLGDTSKTGKMGYNANVAYMNPVNITELDLQKDDNNQYILPPFLDQSGNRVSGMTIVESDQVPAGKFLVGDSTKGKLFIKRNISIATSDNVNDNFLKDKMVMKASFRQALRISSVEAFGWVYGDIETAAGLIAV